MNLVGENSEYKSTDFHNSGED